MKGLHHRSNKELIELIGNMRKTKKLLQPTVQAINIKFWKMKTVLDRLDSFSADARMIIDLRRIEKCKAVTQYKGNYYNFFSCAARERRDFYRKERMAKSLCWSCKYTPKQAGMRKLMLKIKNGGRNNGQ